MCKGFLEIQKQNLLMANVVYPPYLIAQKYTKFELVRSFNKHNKPFTVSTHRMRRTNLLCVVVRFFGFILFCFEMCARFAFWFRFTRISLYA